jgi:hypothetical protein
MATTGTGLLIDPRISRGPLTITPGVREFTDADAQRIQGPRFQAGKADFDAAILAARRAARVERAKALIEAPKLQRAWALVHWNAPTFANCYTVPPASYAWPNKGHLIANVEVLQASTAGDLAVSMTEYVLIWVGRQAKAGSAVGKPYDAAGAQKFVDELGLRVGDDLLRVLELATTKFLAAVDRGAPLYSQAARDYAAAVAGVTGKPIPTSSIHKGFASSESKGIFAGVQATIDNMKNRIGAKDDGSKGKAGTGNLTPGSGQLRPDTSTSPWLYVVGGLVLVGVVVAIVVMD